MELITKENEEERQLQDILDSEKLCGKTTCNQDRIVGGRDSQAHRFRIEELK